jgi:hypothetical protein
MDDSERSYGYSEDIYHGRRGPGGQYREGMEGGGDGPFYPGQEHWERSYEYGPEWSTGQPHPGDFGPEEGAMRTRGRDEERTSFREGGRGRGFGRGGSYAGGESWTWDVEGPHRGQGPEGYRRTDERIHEDVCERLSANGRLDASRLRVRVDDGEVTLEGRVRDRRSKRLAEAIADTVRGVVDVHNRLTLAEERRGRRGAARAARVVRGRRAAASGREVVSGRAAVSGRPAARSRSASGVRASGRWPKAATRKPAARSRRASWSAPCGRRGGAERGAGAAADPPLHRLGASGVRGAPGGGAGDARRRAVAGGAPPGRL